MRALDAQLPGQHARNSTQVPSSTPSQPLFYPPGTPVHFFLLPVIRQLDQTDQFPIPESYQVFLHSAFMVSTVFLLLLLHCLHP